MKAQEATCNVGYIQSWGFFVILYQQKVKRHLFYLVAPFKFGRKYYLFEYFADNSIDDEEKAEIGLFIDSKCKCLSFVN